MSDATVTATSDWVDGVRGRTLRWMISEGISADLAVLTGRVEAMCKRRGLELAVQSSNRLYSRILDFMAAHFENPQGDLLVRSSLQGKKPAGWGEEEEQIWMEWLESQLSPAVWASEVFDGLEEAEDAWGVEAGRWRETLVSLLPFWIVRSRDLLSEVDPRPMGMAVEEETAPAIDSGEVWR